MVSVGVHLRDDHRGGAVFTDEYVANTGSLNIPSTPGDNNLATILPHALAHVRDAMCNSLYPLAPPASSPTPTMSPTVAVSVPAPTPRPTVVGDGSAGTSSKRVAVFDDYYHDCIVFADCDGDGGWSRLGEELEPSCRTVDGVCTISSDTLGAAQLQACPTIFDPSLSLSLLGCMDAGSGARPRAPCS